MMKTYLIFMVFTALFLLSACTVRNLSGDAADVDDEYSVVYDYFVTSNYLQSVWYQPDGPCVFSLEDESNIVLIAKVEREGRSTKISCKRGRSFYPFELTDMEKEWQPCSENPGSYLGLARAVYSEITTEPYPLVHLGTTIPEIDTAYILVKNCHWLSEEEVTAEQRSFCRERDINPCKVKSVAYAALDPGTGEVYW